MYIHILPTSQLHQIIPNTREDLIRDILQDTGPKGAKIISSFSIQLKEVIMVQIILRLTGTFYDPDLQKYACSSCKKKYEKIKF